MSGVAIIDSGGANIASLRFALERLGIGSQLTCDPLVIKSASHVILPGVGAAADAMAKLNAHQLSGLIPALTQPVLGICLGMQLMFEHSEEGDTRCLGVLAGTARRFAADPARPVPHMGWNDVKVDPASALLRGIPDGAYLYFVHSYALPVGPCTVARCRYGVDFSAAVSQGNFHATQFHPERSAGAGARILENFLAMH